MAFPVTQAMRAERRKRAEERQAEYDKLTLQQKLDRLPPEPHATKQRAKLLVKLEKQTKKSAPEPEAKPATESSVQETKKSTKKGK